MICTLRVVRSALLVVAIVAVPSAAFADEHRGHSGRSGHSDRRGVPEFDASAAGTIAALVAGGGILFARRRKS